LRGFGGFGSFCAGCDSRMASTDTGAADFPSLGADSESGDFMVSAFREE
jgi:hypothetical protein